MSSFSLSVKQEQEYKLQGTLVSFFMILKGEKTGYCGGPNMLHEAYISRDDNAFVEFYVIYKTLWFHYCYELNVCITQYSYV